MATSPEKKSSEDPKDEKPVPKQESPKPEPPKELEQDAIPDKTPKIKDTVGFLTADTTMNVLPSSIGTMLTSLHEGPLGNLAACARGNVGIKTGRYMFEAKIVEQPWNQEQKRPRLLRMGFAAEGSLFLGEEENSMCFDNDGYMIMNKQKTKICSGFDKDVIVAVVLNLESGSSNANTISFFKDGIRMTEPQALPEALQGKTLYPSLSFKNVMVHYNFCLPAAPLPFVCKVLQEAIPKEVEVKKHPLPKDGKFTVLFPVGLPDQGVFEWLDAFLAKNPDYIELSDRALSDWSAKSGMPQRGTPNSNDRMDANFDRVRDSFLQVAALQPRHYVYAELQGNLLKEGRAAALDRFKSNQFQTVAEVIVGEPPSSLKKVAHEKALKAKQEASDKEFKVKKATEKRQWVERKRAKDAERVKKKHDLARQKALEEARRKRDIEIKKKQKELEKQKAIAEGRTVEEGEEEKEEDKPVEAAVEDQPVSEDEPEPAEEDAPKVELTAEEKSISFFKNPIPDLTESAFNSSLLKFSIPSADEGFNSIKFSWSKEASAVEFVKEFIANKRHTTRVEDIKPSDWFKKKLTSWNTSLSGWKGKQNEYKKIVAQRAAKKAAAEKNAKVEAAKAQGSAVEESKPKDQKEGAPAEIADKAEPEEPEVVVDFEGLDIFGVEDVCDIGGKMPLFKDFEFEDFALLSLRAELHLLTHSFGRDAQDPERTRAHVDHLQFYYERYFGKQLSMLAFGVQTPLELCRLVNDTIFVDEKTNTIESMVPADLETYAVFIKITEEARRQRLLAVQMGDESAKLRITLVQHTQQWGSKRKGEKRWREDDEDSRPWKSGGWWR